MIGLARSKPEGTPMHPDDMNSDLTDAQYLRQLQAYKDFHGERALQECIVRDRLIKDLT
jgi:hypothetical protein